MKIKDSNSRKIETLMGREVGQIKKEIQIGLEEIKRGETVPARIVYAHIRESHEKRGK
jgi:hypothetical protein